MTNDATKTGGNRRLRVVCVDDNPLLVEVLGRLLTAAGHDIILAHDGLEAWNAIRERLDQIDLVITDHEMPRMNGLELVRHLRKAHFLGRIVVHSSSLCDATRASYSGAGVTNLVTKGSKPDELLKLLFVS